MGRQEKGLGLTSACLPTPVLALPVLRCGRVPWDTWKPLCSFSAGTGGR